MGSDDVVGIGEHRHESLLSDGDVAILTELKMKSQQRAALLAMGIPFAVTVLGTPVARAAPSKATQRAVGARRR